MDNEEIKKKKKSSILLIILVIVLIIGSVYLILQSSSLAEKNRPFETNITFGTLMIDEKAYGNTVFDSSNLDFRTILDKNVENSFENVIYIPFLVGGNKNNNVETPIYDIALQDLEIDCELLSQYVKWKLVKNGVLLEEGSLDYHFDTIKNGRLVLTSTQQDLVPYNEDTTNYDYYEFYLWLSDSCQDDDITKCQNSNSQDELLNKRISGKIEVELLSKDKKKLERTPSDNINDSSCINKNNINTNEEGIINNQENTIEEKNNEE